MPAHPVRLYQKPGMQEHPKYCLVYLLLLWGELRAFRRRKMPIISNNHQEILLNTNYQGCGHTACSALDGEGSQLLHPGPCWELGITLLGIKSGLVVIIPRGGCGWVGGSTEASWPLHTPFPPTTPEAESGEANSSSQLRKETMDS